MLYTRPPSAADLAASGFAAEDFDETADIWPENWPAVETFQFLGTQWRHGMNGPTGLVYEAVMAFLDRKGFTQDEWWQMFNDIRAMEAAALNAIHDK